LPANEHSRRISALQLFPSGFATRSTSQEEDSAEVRRKFFRAKDDYRNLLLIEEIRRFLKR
jgi:hypothetical protein